MRDLHSLSEQIKAEALRLGFSACGIAKAEPVDEATAAAYRAWIDDGSNADMEYLRNNLEKRLNPLLLMPGAKSIISVALNYYPEKKLGDDQYQFAYYAYGQDYHDVLKAKLKELVNLIYPEALPIEGKMPKNEAERVSPYKICVDTVPILDRYWATKAGLGWIGKNTNLIIPHAGSFFFLGEILVCQELDYDSPMESHCGTCTKCLEACPTHALRVPYYIDANKCMSYLTIEAPLPPKGEAIQDEVKDSPYTNMTSPFGGKGAFPYIYGCDRCQLSCPYNQKFAIPTKIKEFTPKSEFLNMRPSDWQQLTIEQYRNLFKGSAVKRAKYEGLMRNIKYISEDD